MTTRPVIGRDPVITRLQIPACVLMVRGVRVELGVEQRGGEMVDLDRNSGKGLDLERRQCKRERERRCRGLRGSGGEGGGDLYHG